MRRSDIAKALETIPDKALLGAGASELTAKQRRFAREVAMGAKGAEAYRRAYNVKTANKKSHGDTASVLKQHPGIAREIEAYQIALAAQEYRTPAALRSLVIQSLTETLLDADTPPAVRVQAARVLGTVTEVAAFTERREVTRIDNSQAARDKLLNEIKDMMRTVDAPAADADSLLAELAGPDPHRDPPPQIDEPTHHGDVHTIPHTQSQSEGGVEKKSNIAFLADIEDPPVDGTEVKNGG